MKDQPDRKPSPRPPRPWLTPVVLGGVIIPVVVVALIVLLLTGCGGSRAEPPSSAAPTPESATLTRVGQSAPPVAVTTLADRRFELDDQLGKVVLINFWATWCPPCRQEMPALQAQVWERFGAREDFELISIAREETAARIAPFVAEHGYGWTFAPDPDRTVYQRFAEAFIPRNYVIGRDGAILFQGEGYEEAEFAAMVEVIAGALGPAR